MREELLMHAAQLCKEAAQQLRSGETPEKQASEVASEMVTKGLIPSGEQERYTQHLVANPEKISGAKEAIASMPARSDALGELSNLDRSAHEVDALDAFMRS